MALPDCGTANLQAHVFERQGETIYLASVSRRIATSTQVDIVVKRMPDSDFITIMRGVDPFLSGTLSWTEYRPQLTKSTLAPNLVLVDNYSLFSSMRANENYFVILSNNWLVKFSVDKNKDESS